MESVEFRENKTFSNRSVEARWCSGYPIKIPVRLMGRTESWGLEARLVSALIERFKIVITANSQH